MTPSRFRARDDGESEHVETTFDDQSNGNTFVVVLTRPGARALAAALSRRPRPAVPAHPDFARPPR